LSAFRNTDRTLVPEPRWAPLLELDPDLGHLLPPGRRAEAARELIVKVHELRDGGRSLAGLDRSSPSHIGLLVLDGVVAREVVLGHTVSTELLGAGDIIRPWAIEEPVALLETTVLWSALSDVRIAVLGRRLAVQLCGYPELYAALIDRMSQRSARLATAQTISQMTRVDRRLLALFWHLAERWGRMTAAGVHVPLRISHRMLGQLIGARRPTISAAVGQLAESGELVRRSDGTWLVPGEPVGLSATAAGPPARPRFKVLAA
jgi:CRP/FNR family transcriptional regulator, cyclic AMP receptor protein